ncbi:hypothetical protein ON010_g18026 [Phytophthora cinnamomi]|nr:hypothetical protein ON010_g18026 [Phytophthora cinnamomi]
MAIPKKADEPKTAGVASSIGINGPELPGWFFTVDVESASKEQQKALYQAALELYGLLKDEECWYGAATLVFLQCNRTDTFAGLLAGLVTRRASRARATHSLSAIAKGVRQDERTPHAVLRVAAAPGAACHTGHAPRGPHLLRRGRFTVADQHSSAATTFSSSLKIKSFRRAFSSAEINLSAAMRLAAFSATPSPTVCGAVGARSGPPSTAAPTGAWRPAAPAPPPHPGLLVNNNQPTATTSEGVETSELHCAAPTFQDVVRDELVLLGPRLEQVRHLVLHQVALELLGRGREAGRELGARLQHARGCAAPRWTGAWSGAGAPCPS